MASSVDSSGIDDLQATTMKPKSRRRSSFVRGRIYSSGQSNSTVLGTCEWSAVEQAACNSVREMTRELEKDCTELSSQIADSAITEIHNIIETAVRKGCVRRARCESLLGGIQSLTAEDRQWEEALYDYKELASKETAKLSILSDPSKIKASSKQREETMNTSLDYAAVVQHLTALHNTPIVAVDQVQLLAAKADINHDSADFYFKKQVKALGHIHNPPIDIDCFLR